MTVTVRLSSKGQLVIPGGVRRALKLSPGDQFHLEVVEQKIVLAPVGAASPLQALYGRFKGHDLLDDLEQEHAQEVKNERDLRH